jgi:hypothetical protein
MWDPLSGPSGDDLLPTGDDVINELLRGSGEYVDENGVLRDLGGDLIRDALKGTGETLGPDNLIKPVRTYSIGMQVASAAALLAGAYAAIKMTAEGKDINATMDMEYIRAMAEFHRPNALWLRNNTIPHPTTGPTN